MAKLKLTLKRIDPVKAGVVYGALMALVSLIVVIPVLLFISASGLSSGSAAYRFGSALGTGLAMLLLPILYGIIGFIFGLVSTALLNFVLSKTKGLDVEFDSKDMEIAQIGEDNIKF